MIARIRTVSHPLGMAMVYGQLGWKTLRIIKESIVQRNVQVVPSTPWNDALERLSFTSDKVGGFEGCGPTICRAFHSHSAIKGRLVEARCGLGQTNAHLNTKSITIAGVFKG
jgi:hypothetical protein